MVSDYPRDFLISDELSYSTYHWLVAGAVLGGYGAFLVNQVTGRGAGKRVGKLYVSCLMQEADSALV